MEIKDIEYKAIKFVKQDGEEIKTIEQVKITSSTEPGDNLEQCILYLRKKVQKGINLRTYLDEEYLTQYKEHPDDIPNEDDETRLEEPDYETAYIYANRPDPELENEIPY